jgi:hypothetical protein
MYISQLDYPDLQIGTMLQLHLEPLFYKYHVDLLVFKIFFCVLCFETKAQFFYKNIVFLRVDRRVIEVEELEPGVSFLKFF